jgi:hypothetical protein
MLQTSHRTSCGIQRKAMSGNSGQRGRQIAQRGKVRHQHDVHSRMHTLAVNEEWLNADNAPDSGSTNKPRQRLAVKTAHK